MAVDDEPQQSKMETEEQSSSESNVKENGESEKNEKSPEEETVLAPAVKHLEENELFSQYYLGQGILTDDEVEQFCEFVRKPMPRTFRISSIGSNVTEVQTMLKSDFLSKNSEALTGLSWYPNGLAWQVNVEPESKTSTESLYQFIAHETACGNLEKQDAVGMLPALLLNIEPHHKVLDMRAMKSAQLVDFVHAGCTVLDKNTDGVIIAGEPYFKRCCDLAEHIPNLFSPHFAIANLDPSSVRGLFVDSKESDREVIKYDRILCDLMSSNDGLCRMNPGGLQNWSPAIAQDHHSRMSRMLNAGASQLAVGGRLVFCTHSMNPLENEAVVATLLFQQKGSVELVDVSAELPHVQYKSGLSKWKLMTRGARWFDKHSELRESLKHRISESVFPPSEEKAAKFRFERCIRILPHQQNTAGIFIAVVQRTRTLEAVLKEERETLMKLKAQQEKLEAAKKRAEEARLAAEKAAKEAAEKAKDEEGQKSDEKSSGEEGVKTAEETAMDVTESKADGGSETKEKPKKVSSESKKEAASKDHVQKAATEDALKSKSSRDKDETEERKRTDNQAAASEEHKHDELLAKRPRKDMDNVYTFMSEEDPVWISIRNFFGMSSDFPFSQLMTKGDDKTSLFYVSPTLKQLIDCNQTVVNFVHAGVKVFCRMSEVDSKCKYRITQEGLPAMFPFLSRQLIHLTKDELVTLLNSQPVIINSFGSKTRQALLRIEKGSVVFVCRLNPRRAESGQLMVSGWSDGLHCHTFLGHYKRVHYLKVCGVDVEDPEKKPLETLATEALTAFAQAASAMERY